MAEGSERRAALTGGWTDGVEVAFGPTLLGQAVAVSTERGLRALLLGDGVEPLLAEVAALAPGMHVVAGARGERLLQAAQALVERPSNAPLLALDPTGTPFELRVWARLLAIPPGERISYGELARSLGLPRGARAVARACAANRLAIAIPCHRVVRGDGALGGYRWGLPRKRWLLERESLREAPRTSTNQPIPTIPSARLTRSADAESGSK